MSLDLLSLMEARQARDRGLARADASSDVLWREAVDRIIAELAADGMTFSADTVRAMAPSPPPGFSFNCWGPRFMAAARAGIITQVGMVVSRQKQGHANVIRLWRGAA